MPLAAGTKLGRYEVQSPLGKGGMGEVYRARDTRLDRIVAVKILPSHLSDDPDAKQRFEREARTISSLNHPNICTLYDVGHQDGFDYLVMEYLEGETLADRLVKGSLPLAQVMQFGAEICAGLDCAHRSGVVHRDLKPGNIMLTKSGAKLMDFGLAKTAVVRLDEASSLTVTMSTPAASHPLTAQGTVVGTFQYMAPEQVEGREADPRSDIFALGAVLYEMATGKRAFAGKTATSTMAAVLEREPAPISAVQPMAPAGLDHVVEGCLAKDPDARWQSAADIGRELRWIANSAGAEKVVQQEPTGRRWSERLLWATAVLALLAAVLWLGLREREPVRMVRSYLPPPADVGFDFVGDFSGPPEISADGSAVAFCARSRNERDSIWVQSLNDLGAKKLEGTEGASFPFWSANGKFIGFFADGQLKKIPASGGPVTALASSPNPRGGAWNQDNVILYEPDYRDSLWRVDASGGTPVRVTTLETGKHTTHRWPRFLPDGKHFLFFATSHADNSEEGVYFGSLQDGSYKRVLKSDSDGRYASGHLLYRLQSQLMAQKFEPSTGTVSGDPETLASLVEYDTGTWRTTFTVSENGLLVYEPGSRTLGIDLVMMDRSGKILKNIAERSFYKGAGRFSPDGKRLAVSVGDPQADIWIFDLERGSRTRLTFGGGTHHSPSWSADGKKVVYARQNGTAIMAGTSIRARLANGAGQEEVLMEPDPSFSITLLTPQLSPDGKYLLHTEQSGPSIMGLWVKPLTEEKKPFEVVHAPSAQARIIQYRLSPDGRWLAYTSTESGREEVYVTHFPSGEGKWQVSQGEATFPVWRGDSKEIYFAAPDGTVYASGVKTNGEAFELEPAHKLFQVININPVGVPYDVSPDGQRIVFNTFPAGVVTPLVLVTNWTAELKK